MEAEILSVGNEVVSGVVADTNAAYIARRLEELGFAVVAHRAVRDLEGEIASALDAACRPQGVVVVSGGLGPTADDLTREAAARLVGGELVEHPQAGELLRAFFARRARPLHASNLKQATLPRGAELMPNRWGTASGFAVEHRGARLFFLPGVPREMMGMFEEEVAPRLAKLLPEGGNFCRTLVVFGLPESELGGRLAELMERGRNPEVGTMVSAGVINVRIVGRDRSAEAARRRVEAVEAQVRALLGEHVLADGSSLAGAVACLLEEAGRTIAIAESCTGGLVAGMLTEVPGISRFFLEGVVGYSNAAKVRLLGVPECVLREHGAVSAQTAEAMARGVKERSGADIGLAVSGIAGPSGGTPEKPVGLVFFALADNQGILTQEERFGGGRADVRDRAARSALNLVRLRLAAQHRSGQPAAADPQRADVRAS